MADRLPHDLEAERAVLGAVLINESALFEVLDLVEPIDFYGEPNRVIYETAVEMIHAGTSVDEVTMIGRLRSKDRLDLVGGVTYVSGLTDSLPDVSNVRHYGRLVKDLSTKRKLIGYGRMIAAQAAGTAEAAESVEEAMASLLTISGANRVGETMTIADASQRVLEDARELFENPDAVGVRTGIAQLDDAVHLKHGKVCVLAGATSSGKTSLALQIADQVSQAGKSVAFFSLEMGASEIATKVIAAGTNTNTQAIESKPTGEILRRIEGYLPEVEDRPLYIDDSVDLNPLDIRAKARQIQMKYGLDLIVVDYLQLMTYRGARVSREQEVSSMSRGIKLAAKSLGIPIILLSQLSRKHLDEKRKPELRDLRESGSIENDADVVMMVHRELDTAETLLLIRKQRGGPLGKIGFKFDGATQRFNATGYHPDEDGGGAQAPFAPNEFNEGDGGGVDF